MDAPLERRFDAMYTEHARAVEAYARRRVPPDAVEDVVAETFVVAWRKFREMPDEPRAWLLGIAHNIAWRHRRGETRRRSLVERLIAEPPPIQPNVPTVDNRVLRALAQLPRRDRELVMLVCWEGYSAAEAASITHSTHVAARARLHRARRRLRRLLDEPSTSPIPEEVA
ncbi:MAG: sigma-70 family RNA polymerase sigma factor [Thermoleophilia bacterium]|nr:sigma-70 family RNA polymerase sigma factor [Thermoleophilia bacterium]